MVKSVERNRGKEIRFMRRIIMALMLASLVAFAVAGAAWVLVAPPAKAAFPGQNGRIVFWREDSGGFAQTWVANRDLSNQHKLTSGPSNSGWAVWKPGGAKLAFDSDRAAPDSGGPTDISGINDIFKMNPDGTGVVKLTDSGSFNGDAGWSPDGKKIAFDSDRRNHQGRLEIHVMDADGSNVRRLTTLPSDAMFDLAPRFSPDGRRIVFTRSITDPGLSALFTVRVNGGGLKQLTPTTRPTAKSSCSRPTPTRSASAKSTRSTQTASTLPTSPTTAATVDLPNPSGRRMGRRSCSCLRTLKAVSLA